MNAHLIRLIQDHTHTIGILILEKDGIPIFTCNTLELPWLNNKKRISCIPAGQYDVIPHVSTKFGNCFWVQNIENRDAILFHAGNTTADTLGCILPGQYGGSGKVLNSRVTLKSLLNLCPKGFKLTIYEQSTS